MAKTDMTYLDLNRVLINKMPILFHNCLNVTKIVLLLRNCPHLAANHPICSWILIWPPLEYFIFFYKFAMFWLFSTFLQSKMTVFSKIISIFSIFFQNFIKICLDFRIFCKFQNSGIDVIWGSLWQKTLQTIGK